MIDNLRRRLLGLRFRSRFGSRGRSFRLRGIGRGSVSLRRIRRRSWFGRLFSGRGRFSRLRRFRWLFSRRSGFGSLRRFSRRGRCINRLRCRSSRGCWGRRRCGGWCRGRRRSHFFVRLLDGRHHRATADRGSARRSGTRGTGGGGAGRDSTGRRGTRRGRARRHRFAALHSDRLTALLRPGGLGRRRQHQPHGDHQPHESHDLNSQMSYLVKPVPRQSAERR